MQHAKTFPPSGSHGWMHCPAWESSPATHPNAAEGTRLHGVAERMLQGVDVAPKDSHKLARYVCHINNLIKLADGHEIEARLNMSATGEFGTADFIGLVRMWGMTFLHVVDLKTGTSSVSPAENSQLMIYGLGALEHYSLGKRELKKTMVILTIHQGGHAKSWALSAQALLDWEKEQLLPAVAERKLILEKEEPTRHGNPSHSACFWCAHKETCVSKHGDIEAELCELS